MRILKNRIKGLGERVLDLFTQFDMHELVTSPFELRKEVDNMSEMKMAKGQGEMETNENGVKRESNKGRGRFDLLPYEGLEELAKWYEAGAEKYGDRNWEKGISVKDCCNRMVRHAIKAANGWMDEGPFAHLCAVIWNAFAMITMIKRHPKQNDFFRDEYLKEIGNALLLTTDNRAVNPTILTEATLESLKEITNVPFVGYTDHSPAHNFTWEHAKDRILTDKAREIKVEDSDDGHGLTIVLDFDNRADLEEFQAKLKMVTILARMGIETTGGNHDIPTDGGFVRADRKDQGAKEG